MSEEQTEAEAGPQLVCEWCGWPFSPPKATGRRPLYCRRSCRQRAYEARQTRREVDAVLALRQRRAPVSSRDETPPAQEAASTPIPAPAAPEPDPPAVAGPSDSSRDETLSADPVEPVLPVAWKAPPVRRPLSRRRVPPSTPAGRRPLLPPPPGMTREQEELPLDGE